jgi:tRNA threonylcarbamoyladenosine biosynthesis protein TsaB
MSILTIRTDNPQAEIGLYDGSTQIAYDSWEAHRQLSATIHQRMQSLLLANDKDWSDISGVVVYQGPGSFTGLRIGLSVSNALAYSLQVPLVAQQNDWITSGLKRLMQGETDKVVIPEYGAPAHITLPKK